MVLGYGRCLGGLVSQSSEAISSVGVVSSPCCRRHVGWIRQRRRKTKWEEGNTCVLLAGRPVRPSRATSRGPVVGRAAGPRTQAGLTHPFRPAVPGRWRIPGGPPGRITGPFGLRGPSRASDYGPHVGGAGSGRLVEARRHHSHLECQHSAGTGSRAFVGWLVPERGLGFISERGASLSLAQPPFLLLRRFSIE